MSMSCPNCQKAAKVIDSRQIEPQVVRRRYHCYHCNARWSSLERVMLERSQVAAFLAEVDSNPFALNHG